MAGRPRDVIHREMDAQLRNWARWACGPLVPTRFGPGERDDPIVADAERCEQALLRMQERRARLYRAVMLRYRNRWMDETCAEAMKTDVRQYRAMLYRAFDWLDGQLSRRAA